MRIVKVADKSAALARLYEIYEHYISATVDAVCGSGCATCCTRNVIMTTLEGRGIIAYLSENRGPEWLPKLRQEAYGKRFIPRFTTNKMASLCAKGEEIPEELIDPSWGACPLLLDGMCTVYSARPFGCRCMLSTKPCDQSGCADLDPFAVTLNFVFLQTIEHLDSTGYTANLTDMLLYLSARGPGGELSGPAPETAGNLIANMSIPVLMIPPEHRRRIQPILADIGRICISGSPGSAIC